MRRSLANLGDRKLGDRKLGDRKLGDRNLSKQKSSQKKSSEQRLEAPANHSKLPHVLFRSLFYVLLQCRLLPQWVFLSLVANGILAISLFFSVFVRSTPQSASIAAQATQAIAAPVPEPPDLLELPDLPELPDLMDDSALEIELASSTATRLTPAQLAAAQFGTAPAVASNLTLTNRPNRVRATDDWTYQDWLDRLRQDAMTIALRQPPRLTILLGDSISVYFPEALLPDYTILNQGISGENSGGLLRRLNLIDRTQPETIFVMIGINDLLRGSDDQSLLENQQKIMRYLREKHPKAKIVVQSILPHAVERVTWEGRDRLLAIRNSHIRELNRRLKVIAAAESVSFLDLQSIFATPEGDLRRDLSTDGLHLNAEGYKVWAIALQLYLSQTQLLSQE